MLLVGVVDEQSFAYTVKFKTKCKRCSSRTNDYEGNTSTAQQQIEAKVAALRELKRIDRRIQRRLQRSLFFQTILLNVALLWYNVLFSRNLLFIFFKKFRLTRLLATLWLYFYLNTAKIFTFAIPYRLQTWAHIQTANKICVKLKTSKGRVIIHQCIILKRRKRQIQMPVNETGFQKCTHIDTYTHKQTIQSDFKQNKIPRFVA